MVEFCAVDELHEKYGLSKTREAENMCNYSEFLRQEGKELDKLEVLEQLQLLHFSDKKIMTILKIDAEYLKCLRGKLQEQRTVVTADAKPTHLHNEHRPASTFAWKNHFEA